MKWDFRFCNRKKIHLSLVITRLPHWYRHCRQLKIPIRDERQWTRRAWKYFGSNALSIRYMLRYTYIMMFVFGRQVTKQMRVYECKWMSIKAETELPIAQPINWKNYKLHDTRPHTQAFRHKMSKSDFV